MSTYSDLLAKAQQLEVELKKEGTVLVGEAESLVKELVQNLAHEVGKEATPQQPANPGAGVQTLSDTNG